MVYKQYTWKDGRSMGCSAQDAGEVIEQIEKETGEVTKESFLDASRPEESPTHNCFEWDNNIAAEKYRLHQSVQIINAVQVVIVKDEGEKNKEEKIPAFVKVTKRTGTEKASYNSIHVALSDEFKRQIVLANAINELKAFQKKYSQLEELATIFEEIEKLEKSR